MNIGPYSDPQWWSPRHPPRPGTVPERHHAEFTRSSSKRREILYPSPTFGRTKQTTSTRVTSGPKFTNFSPAPEVDTGLIAKPIFLTVMFAFAAWPLALLMGSLVLFALLAKASATSESVRIENGEVSWTARIVKRYKLNDIDYVERGVTRDGWTRFTLHMWDGKSEALGSFHPTVATEFADALKGWGVRVA